MKAWFYHYRAAFTGRECEAIIDYAPKYEESAGTVGHGGPSTVNDGIRRCSKRWLPRHDPELRAVFDRLALSMLEANHRFLHQDVDAYPWLSFENAQFTTYRGGTADKYEWHTDNTFVPNVWTPKDRKLSCVLLLSNPAKFKGGALELEPTELPVIQQGDVVVFPSFARHRVTPVMEGERHSLVAWAEGPRLR